MDLGGGGVPKKCSWTTCLPASLQDTFLLPNVTFAELKLKLLQCQWLEGSSRLTQSRAKASAGGARHTARSGTHCARASCSGSMFTASFVSPVARVLSEKMEVVHQTPTHQRPCVLAGKPGRPDGFGGFWYEHCPSSEDSHRFTELVSCDTREKGGGRGWRGPLTWCESGAVDVSVSITIGRTPV